MKVKRANGWQKNTPKSGGTYRGFQKAQAEYSTMKMYEVEVCIVNEEILINQMGVSGDSGHHILLSPDQCKAVGEAIIKMGRDASKAKLEVGHEG